ncbi:hypothetical protein BGW39_000858 [Mortierella sp. 14UC]|nr:hypothetical protein BGW39_000858 [Mortierella sp. 14UC]
MYYYGQGGTQDYTQAMDWYLKAASLGHAEAQSSIGSLYFHRLGAPKDYFKALGCFQKAVDHGYVNSEKLIVMQLINEGARPDVDAEA